MHQMHQHINTSTYSVDIRPKLLLTFIICLLTNYKSSSPPEVFYQKVFLEISDISQESACAGVTFSIKLWSGGQYPCLFFKKTIK